MTHLWGNSPPFNIKLNIPPNFHDAVSITRRLGIRYLWIDAVCVPYYVAADEKVVHGGFYDMSEYYRNATLNIVAGRKDPFGILVPRRPPLFQPALLNKFDDIYVGWLGTDSFCDPRGLNVELFPDAWRYQCPPYVRAWPMQEIRLACRNLVFQTDEEHSCPRTSSHLLTSQLYMQCQQEIRWENGRVRKGISPILKDWYGLVEEYSRRQVAFGRGRLDALAALARNYQSTSQEECGEYMAGLWSNDLFRGLLWRTQDESYHRNGSDGAPSWSWAKGTGGVVHLWPLDANIVARVFDPHELNFVDQLNYPTMSRFGRGLFGEPYYITIQSTLASVEPVEGSFSQRTCDLRVKVQAEEGVTSTMRTRYFLDRQLEKDEKLYALKITRRVALLLTERRYITYGLPLPVIDVAGTSKMADFQDKGPAVMVSRFDDRRKIRYGQMGVNKQPAHRQDLLIATEKALKRCSAASNHIGSAHIPMHV